MIKRCTNLRLLYFYFISLCMHTVQCLPLPHEPANYLKFQSHSAISITKDNIDNVYSTCGMGLTSLCVNMVQLRNGLLKGISPWDLVPKCEFSLFFMVALCNRADHICFHPVVCSSSFFLSFFSSPNLSRRRVDVCHTCTHGVP